ncbi:hypothetical protein A3Q34_12155 [Colwellia sp. PAMC 20917]|uniref:hypothetical protein n=1 Tax=Colwellia sp. PAMC 20917 TaxID=1816218 RepID=UPI0008783157|nr:hypothetical protein [Colwellia sp. PAMC 20917]AOW77540.1 hypothetical protein A3Q34_12155 [Colwellia sp. PAMC 20917]
MGSIIQKSKINFIFIAFFSLATLAQHVVPDNVVLHYWFPIFSILFFITAFPYIDSPKIFITLVLISWISSFIVVKLFLGHFYGYDVIFILLYLKIFSISSATGFITAKFFALYLEKNLFNKKKVIILVGTAISLLVAVTIFINFDVSSENKLHNELRKRFQLAESISVYYNRSRNKNINNQIAIEQKLIDDLYSVKEGIISHGYDDNITISSDHIGISLVYEGIPENEVCNMFDYFSSPNLYGFADTFVNNVLVRSRVNYKNIINSKDICYKSDDKVTIRYTGSYADFDRYSKYLP